MSITVANLQDNRAVFRIFITLLRFSFDSVSYEYLTSKDKKEIGCGIISSTTRNNLGWVDERVEFTNEQLSDISQEGRILTHVTRFGLVCKMSERR
jgi:hypothetical protein